MPATIDALLIVALVLSPGYIFTQLARKIIAYIAEPTDARFFLTIVTTGMVIHALLFPWTSRILNYYLEQTLPIHRWETFFWALITIFVLPVVLGIGVGKLSTIQWIDATLSWVGFGYIDRMPSAWDFLMRERRPAYVRVHLKDDKGIVAGVYADKSFVSLTPARTDIYLEEGWQLDEDGNFHRAILDSQGIWIAHDVMAYVEFLNREEAPNGEPSQKAVGGEVHGGESGRGSRHGEERDPAGRAGERTATTTNAPRLEEELGQVSHGRSTNPSTE